MPRSQIADLAFVHNERNSSFCQESSWCYQLRSLLTGLPASSLVPHRALFSTRQPAWSFSITSQIMLLHLMQGKSQGPPSGLKDTPPPHHLSGLIFSCTAHVTLDTLASLLASDLHRMLALEAPPLHISKSNLSPSQSLLRCHPPPI